MTTELYETKIIEDVIPPVLQKKFLDKISNVDWKFLRDVSGNVNQPYPSMGFVHNISRPDLGVLDPDIFNEISVPLANAIIQKAPIFGKLELVHCRSFLQLPLDKKFKKKYNGIHMDLPEPHLAAVYYFCDSDGDTVLFENTDFNTERASNNNDLVEAARVTPKQGRAVVFDGARYHCSTQPSNNIRLIMNFNFILDKENVRTKLNR